MRKLLLLLGILLFAAPLQAQLILREDTSIVVRVGPFLDETDGVTPVTGATIAAADQAEILKAEGAATAAMAGTFSAVTGADGWYDYTLSTADTSTVGEIIIVMQDADQYLPVFVRAFVLEEAVYDAMFVAGATGYLRPTTAGRTLDITATGAAGIDLDNAEGTLDAAEIGTDAIGAAELAADATTEITAGLVKPITTGTARAGGTSTQILLATAENFTNDDQVNCSLVHLISGTGKGQVKIITDYDNANDTATVDSAWATNPDATSVYQLLQSPCTISATEFAGLVWDAATATYADAGSTGEAVGQTHSRLGTPSNFGSGTSTIAANLEDMADDGTEVFSRTTDSLQAIRDRGDANWTGGGTVYSGTADSGNTTTMVDAARTEGDTDYWVGSLIRFTSGTISGQTRYITAFTPASDTITFTPAVTQSVGTNTYELLPFAEITDSDTVINAIWDEALSGHTTAGSAGKKLSDLPTIIQLPKNVATSGNRLSFFAVGTNGQFTTGASGVACTISLDGGMEASVTDTPTEQEFGTDAATWFFDLTQAETNANQADIVCTGTGMRPAAIHLNFQQ